MSYQIKWEHQKVSAIYSGFVTDIEIAEFARIVQEDERFDTLRYVIEDFTHCSDISYSDRILEELSATDRAAAQTNEFIKVAVVTSSPKVEDMVFSYMSKAMAIYPINIYSSLDSANEWFLNKGIH